MFVKSDASANVGIRTASPLNNLHIKQTTNTIGGRGIRLEDGGSADQWIIYLKENNSDNLTFAYNGADKSTINTAGTYTASDRKLKHEIEPMKNVLDKVMKLRPSTYIYNDDADNKTVIGLIAQDAAAVFPQTVIDNDGNKFINYDNYAIIAVKAIQELKSVVDEKDKVIASLKSENDEMKKRMDAFDKSLSQCCMSYKSGAGNLELGANIINDVAKLEQNTPNPFSENTIIKFYIPQNAESGMIKIYSFDGAELKSISISTKGFGQTEISGKTLSAGTYTYMLLLDGKVVDTKQMVMTK